MQDSSECFVHTWHRLNNTYMSFQTGAVIISPTRELASQIFEVVTSFYDAEKCPFSCMLCIGGQGSIENDLKFFEKNGKLTESILVHILLQDPLALYPGDYDRCLCYCA